jgi:hypothetical protein
VNVLLHPLARSDDMRRSHCGRRLHLVVLWMFAACATAGRPLLPPTSGEYQGGSRERLWNRAIQRLQVRGYAVTGDRENGLITTGLKVQTLACGAAPCQARDIVQVSFLEAGTIAVKIQREFQVVQGGGLADAWFPADPDRPGESTVEAERDLLDEILGHTSR